MSKVYIITGATGNLGGNVCKLLARRGENIRALVLQGDKSAERLPSGVKKITGDILDAGALERLFDVPSNAVIIVIHMAAIVTTYQEYNQKVYDVNVNGTKNMLMISKLRSVSKFIYVSSSSAMQEEAKDVIQTENMDIDPDKVIGFYAKTKAEATRAVMDAVKEGLNASIVFPTAICGPEDYEFGMMTQVMIDCANAKLPAGIVGGFDIADARDVAKGILLCAEKGASGEGYILSGNMLTIKELLYEVHIFAGVREIKTILPLWFMKALLPFFFMHYKVHRRKPVFTSFAVYNLVRNNLYSSKKAERELGYTSRPARETIEDILKWLKDIGKIK